MAHDNEVPDDQKDSGHTIPYPDWLKVRADREIYAQEDTEDIDVPEPDDEDFLVPGDDEDDFEETPDDISREATL